MVIYVKTINFNWGAIVFLVIIVVYKNIKDKNYR